MHQRGSDGGLAQRRINEGSRGFSYAPTYFADQQPVLSACWIYDFKPGKG